MEFNLGVNNNNEEITEDIVSSIIGESKTPYIVKLNEIDMGDYFTGLVYVRQSSVRQNRQDKESYDLKLLCLDGNGEVFEMSIFAIPEKVEVNNKVVLVTEGQKVPAYGKTFYNATSITLQKDQYVPTTAFLKYIDNVPEFKERYKEIIKNLKEVSRYAVVFDKLEESLNFSHKLFDSPYPHKYGGKLGEFLKVFVGVIELYDTWKGTDDNADNKNIEFFTLLALTTLTQPLMREYARFNDSEFFTKEKDKMPLALEPYMVQILYTSGLKENELSIITQSITAYENYRRTGEVLVSTKEQMEFYYCLRMMDNQIFINNL